MKKTITLILATFLVANSWAQMVLSQKDLPEGIRASSGVLYLKIIPIKNDSLPQIPFESPGDATICLSKDPIVAWADYSCQIRTTKKSNGGYMDIRDQGNANPVSANNYLAEDTLFWEYGTKYHCWIDIDYATLSYSVYALKDGNPIDDKKTIGTGAAFRNQVSELNLLSIVTSNEYATDSIVLMEIVADVSTIPSKTKISEANTMKDLSIVVKNNYLSASYQNQTKSTTTIELFDITGKSILKQQYLETAGQQYKEFSTKNLSKGIYFLSLQIGNSRQVEKIILK
jgi:hypothetical protein